MGCGSAERSSASVFPQTDECSVQAIRGNRRRNPPDHDGEEPNAVLPRTHELSRRGRSADIELASDRAPVSRIPRDGDADKPCGLDHIMRGPALGDIWWAQLRNRASRQKTKRQRRKFKL